MHSSQVSPDGRAYFYSTLDPTSEIFATVPRYSVVLERGDALFIPPWEWHRVEYVEGPPTLSASLFHVRPRELVTNNLLYTAVVLPNMLKELLSLNKA